LYTLVRYASRILVDQYEGASFPRLMGPKPKDTPNYPMEEVMNSNSLGLSDIRSRNLRKVEIAKKQTEAQKKLLPVYPATVVTSVSPANAHVGESEITSVESAVKKKRYSIKVDNEAGGVNDDKAEATVDPEDLDPAEFARQERLRKQREKQVKIKLLLIRTSFYFI
jgi:hypothetical protein